MKLIKGSANKKRRGRHRKYYSKIRVGGTLALVMKMGWSMKWRWWREYKYKTDSRNTRSWWWITQTRTNVILFPSVLWRKILYNRWGISRIYIYIYIQEAEWWSKTAHTFKRWSVIHHQHISTMSYNFSLWGDWRVFIYLKYSRY